jgi:hypothetical protein
MLIFFDLIVFGLPDFFSKSATLEGETKKGSQLYAASP